MSFRKFGGIQRSNVSNVVSNNILSTNTLLVTSQVGENNSKIDIKSELDIQNNVNITGDLTVIGNEDVSGNKIIRGNLDVSENALIGGELYVEKDGVFRNNLFVTENTAIKGKLNVTGDSNLNKAIIDTLDVTNNSLVRGNQVILNDQVVVGNQLIDKDCNIGNDLIVTKNIFSDNLNVATNGVFGKNVDISGNLSVGNNLTVTKNIFTNNLNVTTNGAFGKNVDISGNLDVSNNAIVRNNINIFKDATINNDLTVLGNATIEENLDLFSGDLTAPYLNDNASALVPKSYIDSVASGLRITGPCYCTTIGEIDLSGSVLGQTPKLDYDLVPGNQLRILVKNQNAGSDLYPSLQNGIYIADLSGNSSTNPKFNTWYRAPNMVDGTNVTAATTFIFYGTEYARSVFVQTVGNINNPAIIGQTAIQWTLFRVINLTLGKGLEYLNNTDTIQVDAGEGLTFDGNALIVNPNLNLNSLITSGNVTIKGQLNVDQATALKNTLTVSDSTYLNNTLNLANNLQINNTKFQVLAQEGNTIIGGYLNVYGATTLNNSLVVNGNTTINGNLALNDLTMNNLTTNSATINNLLNLNGNLNINNEFTVNGTSGNTVINGTLSVPNNITNLNTLITSSDTTVKGILNVLGQSNLSGGLNSGSTSVTSLSVINNSNLNNLIVSGTSNLSNLYVGSNGINYFSVLGTNGNTTINGTLNVPSGNTQLYSLSANNTSIDGTLGVSGNTNLKTLTTSSDTTIGGQLNVTGSGTFSQQVVMKSGLLSTDIITENNNGLVPKSYVDTMLNGIKPTAACYCTTKGQININSSVTTQFGKLDIKSVLPTGFQYRVLLKNQANNGTTEPSKENGIYIADLSLNSPKYNTWYRALDMNIGTIVTSVTTFIEEGNLYKNTTFYQNQGSNANPAIIEITPIAWSIFSSNNIQAGPGISYIANTLSVNNGSSLGFSGGNQLIVNPNLSLTTLSITSDLSVSGNLDITGETNLSSNLNIKNLNSNTFTVDSPTGNTSITGTLSVTGFTSLNSLTTTGLTTLSTAKIGNNLNISSIGDLIISNNNINKFTVTALNGNTNIGGTLQVVGTTYLSNDFYVNYDTINNFKVIAQSGDTTIAGNLVVNGSGNSTFNSVTIKNSTVSGTLNVTGSSVLTSVSTSNTSVNGTLNVTGNTILNNNFSINNNNITQFQIVSSSGNIITAGNLTVNSTTGSTFAGNVSMFSGVLTNTEITQNPNGLVPKSYVDQIAAGIKVAGPCYCTTINYININESVDTQIGSLDVPSLSTGLQYRILVKNQAGGLDTVPSVENGIYIADLSLNSPKYNTWYRAPNMEIGENVTSTSSFVGYGTLYAKTVFVQNQGSSLDPAIVGKTPLLWIQFRVIDIQVGPGLIYNENVIEVDAGNGLGFNGNQLIVNPNLELTTLSTTGNLDISGNLNVTGLTYLSNNLNINDKFLVTSATGNTTIGGTLTVSGSTSLSSLNATGLSTNSISINDSLINNGTSTFNSNLIVNGATTQTSIGGTLNVSGGTSLSTLSISGNAVVGGTLDVSSDTILTKNLTVNGSNTVIGGILTVSGNSSLSTLFTSGDTTISGKLGVSNEVTLNNNLTVNGISNLSILNTSGTTALGGNLNVTGISTLSNNLYINDINGINKFYVVNSSGNTFINGTLNVNGIGTFENELQLFSGILTGPLTTLENGLVPKSYVDSLAQGLKPFLPCYCASTGPINLNGNVNTQYSSLDVNSLSAGKEYRILVKEQMNSVDNGIYIADLSGNPSINPFFNTWYRAPDMNIGTNVNSATTFINYGNQYSNTTFYQTQGTNAQPAIIGSTPNNWTILSSSQLNVGKGLLYENNILSVYAGNGLSFTGNQLDISSNLTLTNLSTSGIATLNSANIITNLDVSGNTSLNTLTTSGKASLNSAEINETLLVTSDLTVGSNKFQVTATSGNTSVAGTLGVSGQTSLTTLNTTGLATLNSASITTLSVSENTSLNTLTTSGPATLNSAVINNTLQVGDGFYINVNKFQIDSTGNTSIAGTLEVSGETIISNTLNVTGTITTLTALTTSGLATLNSTKIGNNFNINTNGDLSINTNKFEITASNGNTSIAGTLAVTDATTLSSTLGVTSTTTLYSTLTVGGNTTLQSELSVNGATTLSSTLGVTSTTTLYSTLTVGGNTTLQSELSVSGATTISNTLNVVGDFSVNTNKFNVNASNGNTDISGNLNLVSGVLTSSTITSNPNGLVPKSYVDTLASGLKIAGPCYCATTGQIDLSGNITSQLNKLDYTLPTVPGQEYRILVKNQASGSDTVPSVENGIYIANLIVGDPSYNTWYRADDFSVGDNVTSTTTYVGYGFTYAKTIFVQNQGSTSSPAIVGSTPLEWVIFRQVEIKLGPGLIFSSSSDTIQVDNGSSLTFNNNKLIVNPDLSLSTLTTTGLATLNSAKIGNNFYVNTSGDLTVGNNKFQITATDGNTSIAGTLNLTNDFTISSGGTSKFSVTALTGATTISGFTKINNNFEVVGATTTTTIGGTLNVTGSTTLSSSVTVTGLTDNGATILKSTLSVTGATTLKNNLSVTDSSGGTIYFNVNTTNGTTTLQKLTITSDYRIKENVKPLDDRFTVDNLYPVSYKNKITNCQDLGLIADQLQEFYPELVTGEKDEVEFQTVNYIGLIPILIKEIKQMKKDNQMLREKLKEKGFF
jgi:hypothetical protein